MKLFDIFSRGGGARGFHTAVVTTFGVDFAAFEHVLMPQLEGAGASNVVLIGDERMLALATSEGATRPARAGAHYLLHPVSPLRGGVFHSKIVLQLGRHGARLVVGSANATSPGLGGNLELAAALACGAEASPEQRLVAQAWSYLERIAGAGDHAALAAEALRWARRRAPWLADVEQGDPVTLSDGTRAAFLAEDGDGGPSIMERFLALVGPGAVDRLILMSPYWDGALAAARELVAALTPGRTQLLIEPSRALLPTQALKPAFADLHDVRDIEGQAGRFSHAKLVVARRDDLDHVLIGSANCTRAALGGRRLAATNGEACLYRALPRGVIDESLGLGAALEQAPLSPEALAPQALGEAIPLADAGARLPGAFTLEDGALRWRPSKAFSGAVVALVDQAGAEIARLAPERWRGAADGWRECAIDLHTDAVRFARAISEAARSLDVVVAQPEALAGRRKERSGRKAARAAALLEDLDDFDLPLLEAMAELEREDDADAAAGARRPRARPPAAEEEARRLSYEDFMSSRPSGSDRKLSARSTLAGESVDQVRAALNRILLDDHAAKDAGLDPFDLGDDLGEQTDGDGTAGAEGRAGRPGAQSASATPPEPATRPFSPQVYADAVRDFRAGLKTRADAGEVRSREALRLRLMIMIVIAKAGAPPWTPAVRRLACDDSQTAWPRLILNLCAGFFRGSPPPIAVMAMDERYEALPEDLLEAWLTAIWALSLAQLCLRRARPDADLLAYFDRLLPEARARSGLRRDDLETAHARRLLQRLEQIYQPRFGVEHLAIDTD